MSFLDRFRKKGEVRGSVSIKNLPEHHSFIVSLGFTKVPTINSPFPSDDPGAPFHKRDYGVTIKEAADPESQPLAFRTEQPIGYYYLFLQVIVARQIQGKAGIQIENFPLSDKPMEIRHGDILQVNGSVYWPSTSDDDLQCYGKVDDLVRGDG